MSSSFHLIALLLALPSAEEGVLRGSPLPKQQDRCSMSRGPRERVADGLRSACVTLHVTQTCLHTQARRVLVRNYPACVLALGLDCPIPRKYASESAQHEGGLRCTPAGPRSTLQPDRERLYTQPGRKCCICSCAARTSLHAISFWVLIGVIIQRYRGCIPVLRPQITCRTLNVQGL